MNNVTKPSRRNFLKWASVLLGGVGASLALKLNAGDGVLATAPTVPVKPIMKLSGRHWHIYSPRHAAGDPLPRGETLAVYGELVAGEQDEKVGEFYSSCLPVKSPFGPTPFAAASVEVHTFSLADGTILGMGAAMASARESLYTVVGGTGRYAGTRGTYVARQEVQELGGDGTAEFVFYLNT